jgi:golgin subfamily A member 4
MESLSQITEEKKKIEELTAEYEAKLEESLNEKKEHKQSVCLRKQTPLLISETI